VSPPRRLAATLRWLAPSAIAACLAATVAGVVEGAQSDGLGATGALASAGFSGLLAAPACLLGALIVRGLWAAWRPASLAEGLIEEGGGAPRLGAWVAYLLFAAFVVAWATFNGVRTISNVTTFKVNVVALVLPVVVLVAGGVLVAASRPLVDAIAAGIRAIDRPLGRRLGRSLVTPRLILAGTLTAALALVLIAWYASIEPRLGPLDTDIVLHPLLALSITGGVHIAWRRLPPRRAALAFAVPALAGIVAIGGAAGFVRAERPSLLLAIWAQPTIGGLAVETVFDVDDLRGPAVLERYTPVPRPGAPHRDLLLITIDTMRYDHTPLGGGRAKMPALARLGARGVVFDRAVSPSNTTRRSMPALMLGASAPRLRGRVVGWALRLDPRHVPLAERLEAAGYETAGFFCCNNFWGPARRTGYARGMQRVFIDTDGEILATEAVRRLTERDAGPRDAPAFTWLHFIEPHNWMKRKDGRPDKYSVEDTKLGADGRDARSRRYDRALAEVDRFLGDILAAVDAIPEDRRPIVVVTSDHGEGLGNHGAANHSTDLYESQSHVPLVIAVPGAEPRRIDEPVSLTDLAPTLLDLLGYVPPTMPDMDGRSLVDLIQGTRASDPLGGYAFAAMIKDRSTPKGARAVFRGPYKLIDGAKGLELYDVVRDPAEEANLYDALPEVAGPMKALLDARHVIDSRPPF